MRLLIILACLLTCACDMAPKPPDKPEPQAEAPMAASSHRQLNDAIQQPIDRAKAAGDPVLKADAELDKALEDAGG